MRAIVMLLALVVLAAPASRAQTDAGKLVGAARAQLDNANPDSAAKLLERALEPGRSATVAEQTRAWLLYGIAQLMLERAPSARQAFRRALERDASLRVDSLDYLNENLLREFNAERAALAPAPVAATAPLAVVPDLPADTQVSAQDGRYRITTQPTHRSRVVATISPADAPGQLVWGDTAVVSGVRTATWNLRARDGSVVAPNRYVLFVRATDSLGRASQIVERILVVSRVPVDTQPYPRALEPGDFRAETLHIRRGSPAGLAAGLALGAAAAVLPSALGATELNGGQGGDGTAYAVAGAVSLAGIVGFLAGRRTRVMADNIRFNLELRQRDVLSRQAIAQQNRRLHEGAAIRVLLEGAGP